MKKTFTLIALTLFCFTTFAQNTWQQITPTGDLPAERQGHSMVTIDTLVYLFGGMNSSKSLLNIIHSFDPQIQEWEEEEPSNTPPPARFGHRAVVYDNKMYVFFGQGTSNALDDIWEYDPATNEWAQIVPASSNNPVGRFDHTATLSGSVVWIAGGLDNDGMPLNDLWYYSFGSNEFTQCNNIPAAEGVYGHVSACSGSEVYIFGGYQGSDPANTMYKYTIGSAGTWTTENIQGTLPDPTAYSASAQYGTDLYIAGGETSTGVTGSTWVWNMAQQQFTQLADGPAWAYGAFAFTNSGQFAKQKEEPVYAEMLFWGGSADFVVYNDETWIYTTDIEIPTGINENTGREVNIYPNPATNHIYISINNEIFNTASCSYQLFDIMGREVNTGIVSKENQLLDISSIPEGIYFLNIYANNELLNIQKIVKQ